MKKLLLLLLTLGWIGLAWADGVIDWSETAASAAFAAGLSTPDGSVDPLHESRILAMMHAAIHDALNAIEQRFQPYAFDIKAAAGTSPEAAVAAAAHDVLLGLFPQIPTDPPIFTPDAANALVEAAYAGALEAIPDGPAKTQGIQIGEAAAVAILALRAADGSDTPFLDFTYAPGPNPGDFQFIPGTDFAAAPGWGEVTPFVLTSSSRYRAESPYMVSGW
jgi:hypothetical protein